MTRRNQLWSYKLLSYPPSTPTARDITPRLYFAGLFIIDFGLFLVLELILKLLAKTSDRDDFFFFSL